MIKIEYPHDVFEVLESDGGGISEKHVCYFSHEADASSFVYDKNGKSKYEFYRYTKAKIKSYMIFESLNEKLEFNEKTIRQQALNKLSEEEKRVLGLL